MICKWIASLESDSSICRLWIYKGNVPVMRIKTEFIICLSWEEKLNLIFVSHVDKNRIYYLLPRLLASSWSYNWGLPETPQMSYKLICSGCYMLKIVCSFKNNENHDKFTWNFKKYLYVQTIYFTWCIKYASSIFIISYAYNNTMGNSFISSKQTLFLSIWVF